MVTENPLACNNLPSEAEIMPLPKEEVTPPVTKIYLAVDIKAASKFGRKGSLFETFTNPGFSIYFVFDEFMDMFGATIFVKGRLH